MTNQQILQKAIRKAEKNGWEHFNSPSVGDYIRWALNYENYIFSHSFCKAFWGEESVYDEEGMYAEKDGVFPYGVSSDTDIWWKWHLSKMVLEQEPLKYLEKFL